MSPAGDAAREFRASLEQRRAADDLAAPSLEARQRAATYAEDIVRMADALADRIEAEARERAEQIVADAQARADRTIADAEASRAALLGVIERVRADLTAPGATSACAGRGRPAVRCRRGSATGHATFVGYAVVPTSASCLALSISAMSISWSSWPPISLRWPASSRIWAPETPYRSAALPACFKNEE